MPVLTRAQRRRAQQAARKQSTEDSTHSPSRDNKRKYKTSRNIKPQNIKTPPKANQKDKISPTQQLAKYVSKLQLYDDETDSDTESDEKDGETDSEPNYDDRTTKIQKLQQKLVTQETNYKLIGRDKEYEEIHSFIEQHLKLKKGNSFYLCGSPGTGKTATISMIMKHYNKHNIIKINGMSLNNPLAIYSVLYKKIKNQKKEISGITAKNKLEKELMNKQLNKMYIVIIDEMDGLLEHNLNQQTLYDLFVWTKRKYCKLILIGIANSIDLVDRFLPRLKQRNIDPELLIFKPYTKNQLMDIIKYRLNENSNDYFEDIALKLCTQKVAKMYGDIRKLLEIVRTALNVLLLNQNKQKIGFIEMKQILSKCFESPIIDIIKNLPNQQKTILVISCILMNKTKHKYIIYNKLQQFYQFMAKKYILQKISSREFSVIIDSLISDHIVKIVSNKKTTLSNDTKLQITPKVNDIQFALKNDTVLNKFFEIDMIIPKKFIN